MNLSHMTNGQMAAHHRQYEEEHNAAPVFGCPLCIRNRDNGVLPSNSINTVTGLRTQLDAIESAMVEWVDNAQEFLDGQHRS